MNAPKVSYALIVYPEDSGELLAVEFSKYNIPSIAIVHPASSSESLDSKNYHLILSGETLETVRIALEQYSIHCCIPGSESGVPLADTLSVHFALYANDPTLAKSRYNKSQMAITANAAGLPIPKQVSVSSAQQLATLIDSRLQWPVIIKPDNSKGSDGIELCHNQHELQQAFDAIHGIQNKLRRINELCLVQEFMLGTEYVIDTVSYNGKHKITAIWQYHKLAPDFMAIATFHRIELLPAQGKIQAQLQQYTNTLLNALGIRYGAAHTELMLENSEIKLVETGARLHGGTPAVEISTHCTQHSQVEMCVLAYANPHAFLAQQSEPYNLSGHGEILLLITPNSERSASEECAQHIRALPSVIQLDIDTSNQTPLNRIAGLVTLQHDDPKIIHQDIKTIRELEISMLYY